MKESYIHVAMRQYLKDNGWLLIAGEFPGGTDDELNVLSIFDPKVARDNSPSPRQHSIGEIIPDLVAYKDGVILIIEAKPRYSKSDKEKLEDLLTDKKDRLIAALEKFSVNKPGFSNIDYRNACYVPVLAFHHPIETIKKVDPGFVHICVESLTRVTMTYFGPEGARIYEQQNQ